LPFQSHVPLSSCAVSLVIAENCSGNKMTEDSPGDQPMNFVDEMGSRELRFSIGVETRTGCYYLSIPVANRIGRL
jgi:hypothetical protein